MCDNGGELEYITVSEGHRYSLKHSIDTYDKYMRKYHYGMGCSST